MSRRLEYTRIGEAIALEQVSWADADRNLVLVLSTTCPACQDSDVVSASRVDELREPPLVLDIRERDALQRRGPDDRVNIPLMELSVRAPMELSTSDRILLDCSVVSVNRCRRASDVLRESGFVKVTLLAD